MRLLIHRSAYKHGIIDEDIHHAIDHALHIEDIDDDKVLYLGWDTATNLLEIVSYFPVDDLEIVVHAMPMRTRYESLLPNPGDPHD